MELPSDPVIPLMGIYPKNTKTLIWKGTRTSAANAALPTIAKLREQAKRPLIGCTEDEDGIYTQWNIRHHNKE